MEGMMIKMIFVVLLAISMGVPYAGYRLTGRKKAGAAECSFRKRETVQESADLYDDCGCFGKYGFR